MKKCTTCNQEKELSDFHKDKYSISGFSFRCKKCELIRSKIYKRTEDGLISVIYSNQKSNAKKRGRLIPNYTKEDLKKWLYNNGFKILYDTWEKANYDIKLVPSCDRLNDYEDYSLSNIRLVTWNENNIKHYNDVKFGINTKFTKSIKGINIENGETKHYFSLAQASRELNINRSGISNNLRGKTQSSGGYKWELIN